MLEPAYKSNEGGAGARITLKKEQCEKGEPAPQAQGADFASEPLLLTEKQAIQAICSLFQNQMYRKNLVIRGLAAEVKRLQRQLDGTIE